MRKNLIASAVALAFGVTSIAAHADVNTVVGGTMFVDFTNIDQTSKGKDTAAAGTGLDVKRFYLTVDHKFDDFWSANLTTDFQYQSTLSNTNLYVKKAYLQGKWSSEFAVRVGSFSQATSRRWPARCPTRSAPRSPSRDGRSSPSPATEP